MCGPAAGALALYPTTDVDAASPPLSTMSRPLSSPPPQLVRTHAHDDPAAQLSGAAAATAAQLALLPSTAVVPGVESSFEAHAAEPPLKQ